MSKLYQIKVAKHAGSGTPYSKDVASGLHFRAPDGTYYVSDEELHQLRSSKLAPEVVREIVVSELPVKFFMADHGAVTDPPPENARLAVLARLLSEQRANGEVHLRYLGRNRTVPPDGFVQDCAAGAEHRGQAALGPPHSFAR